MTDQEALNATANEFQREVVRRNTLIRGISTQVDNLTNTKNVLEKEIESLQKEISSKKEELEGIDDVFSSKMEEYQAHVDSVQKSLKESENALTKQRSEQGQKESEQASRETELTGRLNNIIIAKEEVIKNLTEHSNQYNESIKDAIESIKAI